MIKTFQGKVHGKTIELDEDLGIQDGQAVEIQIKILDSNRKWGDGILSSAGGWANYPEMDEIMNEIQQNRRLERRVQLDNE